MLIILDLDDTLIDTYGCLRIKKLSDALNKMVAHGLRVPSIPEAMKQLKQIDLRTHSIQETLQRFLTRFEEPLELLDIGLKEYYENIEGEYSIHALKDAQSLLDWLHHHHDMVLVTVGLPKQQLTKMRKAKINAKLFKRITVIPEGSKKNSYEQVMKELNYSPSETLVCGDKVAADLLPAKAIGCLTVHMRWGRASVEEEHRFGIDYAISELKELRTIIESLAV